MVSDGLYLHELHISCRSKPVVRIETGREEG